MLKRNFFLPAALIAGLVVCGIISCEKQSGSPGGTPAVAPPPLDKDSFIVWSFNMEGWYGDHFQVSQYQNFLKTNAIFVTRLPDFVGTQEDDNGVSERFVAALKLSYSTADIPVAYQGIGRPRGGKNSPNEKNTILYNAKKWELDDPDIDNAIYADCQNIKGSDFGKSPVSPITDLKPPSPPPQPPSPPVYSTQPGSNTCNLSLVDDKNPNIEGSLSSFYTLDTKNGGPYSRIVTWGIFTNILTKKKIAIVNTQLPKRPKDTAKESMHPTQEAEQNIVDHVINIIKTKAKNIPIILTGDLNTTSEIKPFQTAGFKPTNSQGVLFILFDNSISNTDNKNYATCANPLNTSCNVSDHDAVVSSQFKFNSP